MFSVGGLFVVICGWIFTTNCSNYTNDFLFNLVESVWEINPNRSLGLVVFRSFRRMNFDCLLMSDSELLRIKNKQKASYKSRKTARSNLNILIRPNDRFGFMCEQSVVCPLLALCVPCLTVIFALHNQNIWCLTSNV